MPKLTPEQLAEIAESGHLHRYEGRNEQADIIFKALDHIKSLEAENARYKSGIEKALEAFWRDFYNDEKPITPDLAYEMRDILRGAMKGADEQ